MKRTGTLGVRPKTFSKELKFYFEQEVASRKVRFFYKNCPLVNKIELTIQEQSSLYDPQ